MSLLYKEQNLTLPVVTDEIKAGSELPVSSGAVADVMRIVGYTHVVDSINSQGTIDIDMTSYIPEGYTLHLIVMRNGGIRWQGLNISRQSTTNIRIFNYSSAAISNATIYFDVVYVRNDNGVIYASTEAIAI